MSEKNLEEIVPPVLNLFQLPPKACGIQKVQWIDFRPVSQSGNDTPIEFNISGAGAAYTDLSRTYLHLRARITKNGNPIEDTDDVSPINLFLHGLFSQVDISLQQKLVYNSGRFYPYKSYIETILNYTKDDGPRLESECFFKDYYGAMNSNSVDPTVETTQVNTGLFKRNQRVKGGKWCDMIGKIHGDLCQMERLILNGVDISIKLYPSSAAFSLMTGTDIKYQVEIDSPTLKVCKVQLEPDIFTGQASVLSSNNISCKYPIRKSEIKSFVVPKGSSYWAQSDIFQNRVPTFMVIGLVSSQSHLGDYKLNPYVFGAYGLNTLTVTRDGQVTPFKSLRMNYSNEECTEAFRNLFKCEKQKLNITLKDFMNGYALYVYRLDDQIYDYACLPSRESGNLSLETVFDEPLKENINVIVYAQFPGVLEIDQFRNVTT
jgi:hypothetical protein